MVNIVGSTDNFARWKPDNMQDHLTIAELSRRVGRSKDRIKQLEKNGDIPSPVRVNVGELRVRLYSPQEVRKIEEWFANARPGPRVAEGRA
jgi:hypothetical protein